ncbi:GNAT family N-acetyltransferase [Clostridium botulinum]|uniref:Acetyltransferase, GNAT family n=5 Tax=Clostridium botulinum TaxID=1491 RepID=A7GIW3_CLOBL|nr:GNAT family N-acetyltransferase [Clostridium botulinum]EKN41704.1 GNAT family acetyltransferase [Clostridium botulinum CFSAN001627]EKX79993.1 GNAT family acetyltransferase [Clostridium botulinum CFSAN001628]ABS40985.1 acetyltransferase, GNAT family [Clostridium botulinum F str. Langeland]ACA44657.1 acetyltransferase, GNAT family [Clostridium botulinum B1 str. Okra]ACO86415.1 acetyltransferase, GNAT family [Clostridium botulinum A2 str. Kyoto]
MEIEYASELDFQFILDNDRHVSKQLIKNKLKEKEIIIEKDQDNKIIGWLRYSYFWDNTPFMNMLYINENYRNKGIGKKLVEFWETEMKSKGYELVMTSTLSNEQAQHFYRKLRYKDAGSLLLDDEPLEIIFTKSI